MVFISNYVLFTKWGIISCIIHNINLFTKDSKYNELLILLVVEQFQVLTCGTFRCKGLWNSLGSNENVHILHIFNRNLQLVGVECEFTLGR